MEIRASGDLPDGLMRAFCTLPRLSKISVDIDSPENLIQLSKAPNLKHFAVGDYSAKPTMTERGFIPLLEQPDANRIDALRQLFAELSRKPHLKTLELHNLWLDDPSIVAEFCEKSNIEALHLPGTKLSPECLMQFAKLKRLTKLEMQSGRLKEPHLAILIKMNRLKNLDLIRSMDWNISVAEQLKAAMPWCVVQRR